MATEILPPFLRLHKNPIFFPLTGEVCYELSGNFGSGTGFVKQLPSHCISGFAVFLKTGFSEKPDSGDVVRSDGVGTAHI